jgi:hypothetical protein
MTMLANANIGSGALHIVNATLASNLSDVVVVEAAGVGLPDLERRRTVRSLPCRGTRHCGSGCGRGCPCIPPAQAAWAAARGPGEWSLECSTHGPLTRAPDAHRRGHPTQSWLGLWHVFAFSLLCYPVPAMQACFGCPCQRCLAPGKHQCVLCRVRLLLVDFERKGCMRCIFGRHALLRSHKYIPSFMSLFSGALTYLNRYSSTGMVHPRQCGTSLLLGTSHTHS